jgi:hypothetical protein
MTLTTKPHTLRGLMKYSRAKIWIRTGLLAIPGIDLAIDFSMCSILGLISGRLGSIDLGVREFKNEKTWLF